MSPVPTPPRRPSEPPAPDADGAPVDDDSAASAGSESQAEGHAAMDAAEDAVIDESVR